MARALLGLGTLILGCSQNKSLLTGAHSIVKVQGGTIHGVVWPLDRSTENAAGIQYSATPSKTSDWISTENFDSDLKNVTNTGGWTIIISNSNGTNEAPNAIKLCSDMDANMNCSLTLAGPIYLARGRPGVRLQPYLLSRWVRFHDDANCDHGKSTEDPHCDKIVKVIITTRMPVLLGGAGLHRHSLVKDAMDDPKGCVIEIGK